jgi:hypothetical protein
MRPVRATPSSFFFLSRNLSSFVPASQAPPPGFPQRWFAGVPAGSQGLAQGFRSSTASRAPGFSTAKKCFVSFTSYQPPSLPVLERLLRTNRGGSRFGFLFRTRNDRHRPLAVAIWTYPAVVSTRACSTWTAHEGRHTNINGGVLGCDVCNLRTRLHRVRTFLVVVWGGLRPWRSALERGSLLFASDTHWGKMVVHLDRVGLGDSGAHYGIYRFLPGEWSRGGSSHGVAGVWEFCHGCT